jgi:hypothetical protein
MVSNMKSKVKNEHLKLFKRCEALEKRVFLLFVYMELKMKHSLHFCVVTRHSRLKNYTRCCCVSSYTGDKFTHLITVKEIRINPHLI